ncbi:MAG: dTMP kinase [Candidatus Nanoarchaeia archaeon]
MLITFEGIDGSGKTTQTRLLKKWLESQGKQVILTEEPTNNEIGNILKKQMKTNTHSWVEAILFAADRALHCEQVIIPNLDKIVICDRYTHSTLAYQTSMGLDHKWVTCLNKNAPTPDLTIYLDIKPETAMKRISKRNKQTIKYEKLALLKKVRQEYLRMKSKKFIIINAEKPIKDLFKEIRMIVNKLI